MPEHSSWHPSLAFLAKLQIERVRDKAADEKYRGYLRAMILQLGK